MSEFEASETRLEGEMRVWLDVVMGSARRRIEIGCAFCWALSSRSASA